MPRLAACGETKYMYNLCVAKGNKARVNLTVDPDIYREARRVFDVMDLNMSAFLEMNLAQFLNMVRPLTPLLDDMQAGKVDPSEVKSAARAWLSHVQSMVGGELVKFGETTGEVAKMTREEVHTDKK